MTKQKQKSRSIPCVDCGALIWRGSTRCLPCRGLARRRPLSERFTEKYQVNAASGCWEWIAAQSEFGYGMIDQTTAHRVSWNLYRGEIPEGLAVLHRCHNPPCVNPEH